MRTPPHATRLDDALFVLTVSAFASAILVASAIDLYERTAAAAADKYKAATSAMHESKNLIATARQQRLIHFRVPPVRMQVRYLDPINVVGRLEERF